MTAPDIERTERFAAGRPIADAVLFEGYMLYPYRADDRKNQVRWQFGVLAPPRLTDLDPSEHTHLQTECLLEGQASTVHVQVRLLHVQRRTVEQATGTGFVPVDCLDVGDATYLPWDEGAVHESVIAFALDETAHCIDLHLPQSDEHELLHAPDGAVLGRLVRRREPLHARVSLDVEPLPGPYGVRRLRLRLENLTAWSPVEPGVPDRPSALRHALVAAHLLLAVDSGAFISLLDPPEWAKGYVAECEQLRAFPVLAGPANTRRLVLASPIILYDHPQIAPESVSEFCDGLEMDEMLTLRTLTLSEQEKRLVRGSDPRGLVLVDQIDNLPPQMLDRLHGAIRSMSSYAHPVQKQPAVEQEPHAALSFWDPLAEQDVNPEVDCILVDGTVLSRGSSVRLHPNTRNTDAQDMFLDGRTATVEAVLSDLDGGQHVAVTLDELAELDPDGINPHGRFLYFAPGELEPLGTST
ncbi:MAG: hypothetical protein ABI232_11670 [Jatrophihabitantaceae bacterium]